MKKILLVTLATLGLVGCSSTSTQNETLTSSASIPFSTQVPLIPKATSYMGDHAAVIQHILPDSAALKSGFKVGDQIISLNGKTIKTASEFEGLIKFAPTFSRCLIIRNNKRMSITAQLNNVKPRFGAGFEPAGIALIKNQSPLVSYMHKEDITLFATASVSEDRTKLRVNLITGSSVVVPGAKLVVAVYQKGVKQPLGSKRETIDALGATSHFTTLNISPSEPIKGPIVVSTLVANKNFIFEFH